MSEVERHLVRAGAARELPEFSFRHPLNPDASEIHLRTLGAGTGLERVAASLARVPPGKESFVYHFMGFPAPGPGHQMRNPLGGEHRDFEIGYFPRHEKRLVRTRTSMAIVDDSALEPFVPRPMK